jgi:hypothetical protein
MKWKLTNLQTRLYLITALILFAGLGSATFIYLTAENVSDNNLILQSEISKAYRHDLELVGGKMNVLADEFLRWFDSLWRGKPLAFTVACITIILSFGVFFVAYHSPPP